MAKEMILDAVKECYQFPEKLDTHNLKDVLELHLDGSAKSSIVAYQQRQLIEDIVNYVGEDPLKPWIRFIKWAKETFPSGAKSKLLPLLQLCTKTFLHTKQYYDDLRYLRLWVRYADCSSDPLQIFAFMEDKQIGQNHSLFYEAYAVELEIHRDLSTANEVYQKGLLRQAQPMDQLEKMYKNFLKRKEKLVKHHQDGFLSTKFVNQPLSTLPNNHCNLLERLNIIQRHSKKHRVNQILQSTTPEAQQTFEFCVHKEHERENFQTDLSHDNPNKLASTLVRNTSNGDGLILKDRREVIHAFKVPEGVDISFEELRAASWIASQNQCTPEEVPVRPNQVGMADMPQSVCGVNFNALREHEVCQSYGNKATSALTGLQASNGIKSSNQRGDADLSGRPARNQVDASNFNHDLSASIWNEKSLTIQGSYLHEGQMEDMPKRSFSSKTYVPLHGDETIAIKKFVDVAIASRIDPDVGNMEVGRHHGLVDPTINTKEAMADILSLFTKPLPFEPSCKQIVCHEQNAHKAVINAESQEFSVLADDGFNNLSCKILHSQQGRQEKKDTLDTSNNMDFMIFVDDDLKESCRSHSTPDTSIIREDMQEEECRISKNEKPLVFPGVSANNSQQVADGQIPQKMDFMVYIDDHLKESAIRNDDETHKDKENIQEKQRTDLSKLSKNMNQEAEGLVGNCTLLGGVNPWDDKMLSELLRGLSPPLSKYKGFHFSSKKYSGSAVLSTLKKTARNKSLELGNKTYLLKGCIGEGAFARVYQAYDDDSESTVVLKVQKPPCPWEFYVYRQLDKRIPKEERNNFGYAWQMDVYADFSIMVADYGQHGTLQDVINSYLATNQKMEEVLCMYYTIEMLHILEILHSVGIIHADFKPDNLLIRNESEEWEEWTPNRSGCWKHQGLCLIDWGRSIDTTLYPEGTEFVGDCKTSAFRCIEMVENRPWSFQADTYGLCGVVHCMLHGCYMELDVKAGQDQRFLYRPKAPFKRYDFNE
ncbi:hypothetical protein O6H91_04G022800 [Diphasiastrum complanatum]|uniref:Uncharacterized protein n=2 Tax=Diphasiastrum complanatum TaxID=34168 RepID=A0ACC2DUY5_DIPCM|nr:hypothetical protein O6H91_04G022800 [Diphasiastrum complanatum]